jgi:hypothetical protein
MLATATASRTLTEAPPTATRAPASQATPSASATPVPAPAVGTEVPVGQYVTFGALAILLAAGLWLARRRGKE